MQTFIVYEVCSPSFPYEGEQGGSKKKQLFFVFLQIIQKYVLFLRDFFIVKKNYLLSTLN